MAHEISINSLGQSEAVFGFGERPWWDNASMPATVLPNAVSFDQIFSIAFPWTAEMEQLQYADGSLSSQHGIRRSDTKMELGVHSGSYGNIQPRDLFDFCAAFFREYPEVPIASAIAMQGGAVLNLSARLGEINILNSGDIHKSYLCFVNSFNGRVKAQVYKSYVRPVCMNTTISGISSADFSMQYKHTKNVRDRIARDSNKAAQLMLAQQATDDRVKEVLEKLAKRKLKKETYIAILDDLFPGEKTRAENIKKEVTALFADNDNNKFPEWKNTAYALFNAVTNYADHDRVVRMTKGRDYMSESQVRFESSIIGEGADLKQRALERILVLSDGTETIESAPMVSLPPMTDTPQKGNTRKTSQNASQPIIEVKPVQISSNDPDASVGHSERKLGHTDQFDDKADYDDSQFVKMDLYTLAPAKHDLAGTVEIEIVEKINDNLIMRHVECSEDMVLTQIEVYKDQGYFVVGSKEWNKIQADKEKK